jgi:hypothetical protein
MKKTPRQIIGYLEDPNTWDRKAFETAIRQELETHKGALSPSDELMVGMLVMTTQTLLDSHTAVSTEGYIFHYNSGDAISPHMKVRTECLDKIVKILKELDVIGKVSKKPSEVDELFATT